MKLHKVCKLTDAACKFLFLVILSSFFWFPEMLRLKLFSFKQK